MSGGICLAKNLIDYKSHYSAYDVSWTPLKRVVYCVRAGVAGVRDADDFPLKSKYIDLYGGLQRIAKKNTVEDADATKTVIRLKNGYLSFLPEQLDTGSYAASLAGLKGYLDGMGVPLLFTAAPYKIAPNDSHLPEGMTEYANANTDGLLNAVSSAGISCMDLRKTSDYGEEASDRYDNFFRTDHHWTPRGAFNAFGKVAECLKEDYSLKFDSTVTDIGSYNSKTYERNFLGSYGKRTGKLYAAPDDFEIITPDFATSLDVVRFGKRTSGSFENVIFNMSKVTDGSLYDRSSYNAYDVPGNTQIINNNAPNDTKILLVRDSFGYVFAPFLSLICAEVDNYDMRDAHNCSLKEYIADSRPDIVVFLYNPTVFSDIAFDFDSINSTAVVE